MADMSSTSRNQNANNGSNSSAENTITPHKSKYRVTTFGITDPELTEPVFLNPASISMITIVQDFDNWLQPIVEIECILPPIVLDFINTHQSTMAFTLRLQEKDYLSAQENFTPEAGFNDNGLTDICNDKFITISADTTKTPNLNSYQAASEIIDGKRAQSSKDILRCGSNLSNYTEKYKIFIWREDDLYNLRSKVNAVFSNINVGDACAAVLSDNNFKRILMCPSENTGTVSQLIIPPMSMMNVFDFIQTQYGLYSTDVLFFSDIYRTYIIDKSGECKAHENNEYPKVIFSVVDDDTIEAMNLGTCRLDAKKEYHEMVPISDVVSRSLSNVNDVIHGNNSVFVNSRTNEVTTVSGAGNQRGSGCVNITNDNEGSPYIKARQANSISELNQNLKIVTLTDYSYKAITPNKAFIFSFKNKDQYSLNGYYRLVTAKHFLNREGQGEEMAITGQFEFVRKKVLDESERQAIEYDVFKTAQEEKDGTEKSKANSTNSSDKSYQQSEANRVSEGKQEKGNTSQGPEAAKTTAPKATTSSSNKTQKTNSKSSSKSKAKAPIPLDKKNK